MLNNWVVNYMICYLMKKRTDLYGRISNIFQSLMVLKKTMCLIHCFLKSKLQSLNNYKLFNYLKFGNRTLMSSSCIKCRSQNQHMQTMLCGHFLCNKCLPPSSYRSQIIISCPICLTMTIFSNDDNILQTNPDNYIICIDCKSEIMNTKQFIQSKHRKHNVVYISKIVGNVRKQLKKLLGCLSEENQRLLGEVQGFKEEKNRVNSQYNDKILQIKNIFDSAKNTVEQCEKHYRESYEKLIINELKSINKRIQQSQKKIIRYESYIESIGHNLIKQNQQDNNYDVATTQFYFQNQKLFTNLLTQLHHPKNSSLIYTPPYHIIKSPNLHLFTKLISKLKQIPFKQNNSSPQQHLNQQKQLNQQNQIQNYFLTKRKQILQQKKNINIYQNQQTKVHENYYNCLKRYDNDGNYGCRKIQSRLEDLRRTLNLDQKTMTTSSNFCSD